MNKTLPILIMGMFLILPIASAGLLQSNKVFFKNTLGVDKINWLKSQGIHRFKNYGTYEIHDSSFLGLLRGDVAQEYTLLESGNSIINAWAYLEVTNYKPSRLLSNLWFKGGTPRDVQVFYLVNESYEVDKPIYKKVCGRKTISINRTIQNNCRQVLVRTDKITKYREVWKLYHGQILPIGTYKIKITGKLPKVNHAVDWILKSGTGNYDLEKWAWWNSSWSRKREINITENSGSTLNNYSVLLYVTYDADMNADFSDLRFTNSAEDTELGYWIDNKSDSNYAYVWVKVPTLTASSNTIIYMYYGDSGASSESNIKNAFLLGDDFDDGSLDTSLWNTYTDSGGSIVESGGILTITQNAGSNLYSKISSTLTFGINTELITRMYLSATTVSTKAQLGYLNNMNWASRDSALKSAFNNNENTQATVTENDAETSWTSLSTTGLNSYGKFIVRRDGSSNVYFYKDGSLLNQHTTDIPTSSYPIEADTQVWSSNNAYIYIDWLYVKVYTSSEPTYTIGAEQASEGVSTTLNSPTNNTQTNNQQITFNWTSEPTNVNLTNTTLYIWYSNGTLFNTTSYTLSGNESVTTTYTQTLSDGDYIWNAETCSDSATLNCSFANDNWTLSIDATSPSITINSPTGTFDYMYEDYNLELNFTAVDNNLDTCWYEYNNTNTTVSCTNNTLVSVPFNYEKNENNLTVYVNDTYGNLNSNSISWDYKLFEINNTYNNITIENNLEDFLTYSLLKNGLDISHVYFIYNKTEYSADSFTSGDYTIFRKNNFLVPQVSYDENETFYWKIILSDSTIINLNPNNQTVYNLEIDNCSSYTNDILNLTLLDEETQEKLSNPIIEAAINIYSSDRNNLLLNYSLLSNSNPTRICLNKNLLSNIEYSMDSIIRYETNISANEYYNIVNYTLNNYSGVNNINLYDLDLDDSTEFQLTFTGSDFLPVENALIYVNRQYISENDFKTVELPKTDYNGQTILHLVRNDVIYNIIVVKDGKVLGTYNNLVAFCDDYSIGDCNIELNAFSSVENIFDYYNNLGLTFSTPTYNKTNNNIKFNFLVTDGSSKTISMNISRNDIFGNVSICDTSLTSSGGTLTCTIDPNLEDTTLKVDIYLENNLIISSYINLENKGYGESGYLILFIMAISFILMFSGSKSGVLISIIITFVGGIGLGIINGTLIGLGASGIWLLLIIIIGLWKLNSERQQ